MAGHKRLRRKGGLFLNLDLQENDTPFHDTSLSPERPLLGKTGLGDRELRIPRPSVISTKAERLGAGETQRKEEIKGSLGINLMGFYFCFFSLKLSMKFLL